MHKRGLNRCAVNVWCLSLYVASAGWVSVTFVYCVETTKHIRNHFSPSGSHTILVFPHQMLWQYSDAAPLTGASNANRVQKTAIFDQHLLYLGNGTRQTHSQLLWNAIGTLRRSIEWCHFQWRWVTLNPDFKVTPIFDAEYLRNGTR